MGNWVGGWESGGDGGGDGGEERLEVRWWGGVVGGGSEGGSLNCGLEIRRFASYASIRGFVSRDCFGHVYRSDPNISCVLSNSCLLVVAEFRVS